MSVGIGITTRNRPKILQACLAHFAKYAPLSHQIAVIDDCTQNPEKNQQTVANYADTLNIQYHRYGKRAGIARAKNACLWELQNNQHIFLFDDDAWPSQNGWSDNWINNCETNQIGHSMFIQEMPPNNPIPFFIAATIGTGDTTMHAWSNCMGPVLYFNKECLTAIGGYDANNTRNPYGYEHVQISIRCAQAGFTKGHRYLSPANASELIYSLDIHQTACPKAMPIKEYEKIKFKSSATPQEVAGAAKNIPLMDDPPIFIPLENPYLFGYYS